MKVYPILKTCVLCRRPELLRLTRRDWGMVVASERHICGACHLAGSEVRRAVIVRPLFPSMPDVQAESWL